MYCPLFTVQQIVPDTDPLDRALQPREILMDRDPYPLDRDPQKEHGTRDRDSLEGTWDQAARQEVTSYRDPPEQTNRCKNSTLPQTSFAGGNK